MSERIRVLLDRANRETALAVQRSALREAKRALSEAGAKEGKNNG